MKIKRLLISQIFVFILFISTGNFSISFVQANGDPTPVFSITLLCSDTMPKRIDLAYRIQSELAHIGISASIDLTSWANIYPRTWAYGGPYPIPTYDEGGFDVLFLTWSWGLNFNPYSLFSSDVIVPNGDNHYQYNSTTMDSAIDNFNSSILENDRIYWAEQIQDILYEDNFAIQVLTEGILFPHDPNLVNWDARLWEYYCQSMENWTIPEQSEFHYAVTDYADNFHPLELESIVDQQFLSQIYNGLLMRYPSLDNHFGPRVATSWTTTDGLNYTIELNPNAKWADGTPLNASDVEYSYKLCIEPFFAISNLYEEYIDENSVTIIDVDTVKISFRKPYVYQENNLGIRLVPKHIWESIDPEDQQDTALLWATTDPSKIFGCGPYKLANFDYTYGVVHLERNEYFDDWTGITPYFDDIYFRQITSKTQALANLTANNIDMIDDSFLVNSTEVPVSQSYTVTSGYNYEFGINMEHPYLGTGSSCPIPGEESARYIRKAISHIIPRQAIIDDIFGGVGSQGITSWPEHSLYFKDQEPYEYNITKAQEYMVRAGFDFGYDSDGDGVSDFDEINIHGTNPYSSDTDGDSLPDDYEIDNSLDPLIDDTGLDPDLDGLINIQEYNYGTDPQDEDSDNDWLNDLEEVTLGSDNYLTDPLDSDSDDDGLTDGEEAAEHTNPNNIDTDSDGLDDYEEVNLGVDGYVTDPLDPDTDDDLMPDGWEFLYGLEPLIDDSALDPDDDNLTNLEEFVYSTNPLLNDTDTDGMYDEWEVTNGLNPLIDDSGDDEDSDELTNLEEQLYGTDPQNEDTDGDSFSDKEEIDAGTDPLDPNDYPTTDTSGLYYLSLVLITLFSMLFIIIKRRKK